MSAIHPRHVVQSPLRSSSFTLSNTRNRLPHPPAQPLSPPLSESSSSASASPSSSSISQQQQQQQHQLPNLRARKPNRNQSLAIDADQISLRFNAKAARPVLDRLSIHIPRGSIYALLGPSGCGKTSLIRCLLRLIRPDDGTIQIFGESLDADHRRTRSSNRKLSGHRNSIAIPGADVGYMPQDCALHSELTIRETLRYFRTLYGIDARDKAAHEYARYLRRTLYLGAYEHKMIGTLSGGTKRRVSLAVAMIHQPPLLILDEPTVGVDPLIRQSIWNLLKVLSAKDKLTVLITTHYVEEARAAHLVGFMRHGRLLEQDSPRALMQRYARKTLEQVFLLLTEIELNRNEMECNLRSNYANDGNSSIVIEHAQTDDKLAIEQSMNETIAQSMNETIEQSAANTTIDMSAETSNEASSSDYKISRIARRSRASLGAQFGAMIRKNFRIITRHRVSLFLQLLLPTIQMILFCACIGRDLHSIRVAIFDDDRSPFSGAILREIDPRTIRPRYYGSLGEAIDAVRRGEAISALAIYRNFSTSLYDRITAFGDADDREALRNSTIHIFPDMSNHLTVITMQQEIFRAFLTAGQRQLAAIGASPHLMQIPIETERPIYGLAHPPYTEYMAPGVIASIAFLAAIPLTAISFVRERREQLFERARVTGVPMAVIFLAHISTYSAILIVQIVPLIVATFAVIRIPYSGDFVLIAALIFMQSICGMCFGLFVASLATDANGATMLALGFFYPNLLLSGTVWPIDAMSDSMRALALSLPQTYPIIAMRYMITRGWGLAYWQIVAGFAITGTWCTVFIVGAICVTRLRDSLR